MKKLLLILTFSLTVSLCNASPGDSIFNMSYIHTLYITFPYPNFYDSLLYTNTTDEYIPVNINFNGEIYNQVGIKVKGNSSFNNPSQKKSFKIDCNIFVQGQDIHGLKKLNFNNSFKDPSFMREKLTNDFLIAHKLPAPRTTYCNVYMNGQLWGLYTLVEEIDDEFCWRWFNSNDGNLFKGDPKGTLQWKGSANQLLYEADYELKNNSTINDWSDLITLINIINNTPDVSLPGNLDARLHTSKFLKQWAATNIFVSLDSYLGSGHNYYMYHDTVTDKFQWISWDANESFGSFKLNLNTFQLINLDMYYVGSPGARPLCEKMLNNVYYKELYNYAYCELKDDFTNAYFDPKIDSVRPIIQASVYADPKKFYNNAKFDSSFNFDINLTGPGGLLIFGLKPFITSRAASLQNNINSHTINCALSVNESAYSADDLMLYPNPTSSKINFQGSIPIYSITLFDAHGQLIRSYPNDISQIDVSSLRKGIYILRINEIINKKIVIN